MENSWQEKGVKGFILKKLWEEDSALWIFEVEFSIAYIYMKQWEVVFHVKWRIIICYIYNVISLKFAFIIFMRGLRIPSTSYSL